MAHQQPACEVFLAAIREQREAAAFSQGRPGLAVATNQASFLTQGRHNDTSLCARLYQKPCAPRTFESDACPIFPNLALPSRFFVL